MKTDAGRISQDWTPSRKAVVLGQTIPRQREAIPGREDRADTIIGQDGDSQMSDIEICGICMKPIETNEPLLIVENQLVHASCAQVA